MGYRLLILCFKAKIRLEQSYDFRKSFWDFQKSKLNFVTTNGM